MNGQEYIKVIIGGLDNLDIKQLKKVLSLLDLSEDLSLSSASIDGSSYSDFSESEE